MLNPKFKLDPQFVKSRNRQLWLTLVIYCLCTCAIAGVGSAIGAALFTGLRSGKITGALVGAAIAAACILWREDTEAKKRAQQRALNRQLEASGAVEHDEIDGVTDSGEDPFPVSARAVDKVEAATTASRLLFPALGALLILSLALVWVFAAKKTWQPRTIRTNWTVEAIAFSPDSKTLAVGGYRNFFVPTGPGTRRVQAKGAVGLWDVSTSQLLRTMWPTCESAIGVAFTTDGSQLSNCCNDCTGRYFWDVQTGKLQRKEVGCRVIDSTHRTHPDRRLAGAARSPGFSALSPDGKLKYVVNQEKIKLFDTKTKKPVATLNFQYSPVMEIAFSSDNSTLAASGVNGDIKLFDIPTRKILRTLKGHRDLVTVLAFSPDGSTLASVSWDRTVKLWRIK